MRIKSEIWVQAYLRRCMGEGISAYVVSRGDEFAGAIFIHIDDLKGGHRLFGPAPSGFDGVQSERKWTSCFEEDYVSIQVVNQYLSQQKKFDPDLWVIDLEDRGARHLLADELIKLD